MENMERRHADTCRHGLKEAQERPATTSLSNPTTEAGHIRLSCLRQELLMWMLQSGSELIVRQLSLDSV